MSESQQRSKKKKAVFAAVEEKAASAISIEDIFGNEEAKEVKQAESKPKTVAKKTTAPVAPNVYVNVDKLLIWAARLKGGSFGQWGNGANFANHMVKDSFTVGGKEISIEEASQMIGKRMSRRP
jgi:hypothetical protein